MTASELVDYVRATCPTEQNANDENWLCVLAAVLELGVCQQHALSPDSYAFLADLMPTPLFQHDWQSLSPNEVRCAAIARDPTVVYCPQFYWMLSKWPTLESIESVLDGIVGRPSEGSAEVRVQSYFALSAIGIEALDARQRHLVSVRAREDARSEDYALSGAAAHLLPLLEATKD
jgi:hypothetical protein